jgi:hypothetical protein
MAMKNNEDEMAGTNVQETVYVYHWGVSKTSGYSILMQVIERKLMNI